MALRDPYQILGVSKTATQDEIKSAYRKLAKTLHPDFNPNNKDASEKFKDVSWAYAQVGTAEARTKWDNGGTQEQQEAAWRDHGPYYYETQTGPDARYTNNFGDSQNFEDLFSNIFGRRNSSRRNQQSRDNFEADENYQMEVDLSDALRGAERVLTLPSGVQLQVKIPPGIREGQKLRLAKKSSRGGDVFIEIKYRIPPRFRRMDFYDLEMDVPISLSEAVLGGEIRVPVPEGHIVLTVKKGANTGTRLRIRGKGLPKKDSTKDNRGDAYAVLKVQMPEHVDPELESAIRNWSKTHSYDPRAGG